MTEQHPSVRESRQTWFDALRDLSGVWGYVPPLAILAAGMGLHYWGIRAFGRTLEATFFVYTFAILVGAWYSYGAGLLITFGVLAVLPFVFNRNFTLAQVNVVGLAVFSLISIVVSGIAKSRARAERALRELNASLEQRVAQQTAELRELLAREQLARHDADAANRLKDDFLATLSHELRTPLSAVLGWAQMLRRQPLSTAEADAALATIERNAETQAHLIEEMLDLSRLVSGKLELDLRPLDPAETVAAAVKSMAPSADAKGVRLENRVTPSASRVQADPDRLQQILTNLLSNAIKFTPKGSGVTVSSARGEGAVDLIVRDNGVGISPAFLPHVFERFRQADASFSRKYGGLGIGLAVVRRLVDLHGGSVKAESEGEGKGSTFTVRLPTLPATAAGFVPSDTGLPIETSTELQGRAPLHDVTALIVDDQPDSLDMVAALLRQRGATVVAAGSSGEALDLLSAITPHVIVSDIGMPGEDGLTFMKRVRELERREGRTRVPAVALTAYARAADRERVLAAGYQVHVPKPVNPDALVGIVQQLTRFTSARPRGSPAG